MAHKVGPSCRSSSAQSRRPSPLRREREHVLSPFSRNHSRERFGAQATARPVMSLKEPSHESQHRSPDDTGRDPRCIRSSHARCLLCPGTSHTDRAECECHDFRSRPASIQESLLLTKTCDATAPHCTVMTSSAGPIPVDSDIEYFGPLLEARTTSRIVVTTPGGDTATGNCSLSYRTFEGTCVLTDGTGALAGLHANLKVSSISCPIPPACLLGKVGTISCADRDSQYWAPFDSSVLRRPVGASTMLPLEQPSSTPRSAFRPMALTAAAMIVGAAVILFDPIFQGLAISLMAGEVASLLLSRMAVPVLYYMAKRHECSELVAQTSGCGERGAFLGASNAVQHL